MPIISGPGNANFTGVRLFRGFRYQRAHRADVGATVAVLTWEVCCRLAATEMDDRVKASFGKGKKRLAVGGAAQVDALSTEHAAVGVVGEAGMAVVGFRILEFYFNSFGF